MTKKPTASLSVDLDNKWAYMKTHGDPDWESYPSYLNLVVPRFLNFFESHQLKATVFVVGQDAALEKNQTVLASIAEAGHEIGNHSYHHEPWLHLYTPNQLKREFEKSESVIEAVTGQSPVGFRGPGFSISDEVLRTLIQRGYEYDGSTFPTFLGPVARAYFFFNARLSREQKEERKELFGSWRDGFRPNRPFHWTMDGQRLLEIPVTTMPLFKVPIHASYLHYLAGFSTTIAKIYFATAIKLARLSGVQPSLLLHPLDFMGAEDDQDLAYFPGMNQSAAKKIRLLSDCLTIMSRSFEVVTMREHANSVSGASLKSRSIDTATAGLTTEFAEGCGAQ